MENRSMSIVFNQHFKNNAKVFAQGWNLDLPCFKANTATWTLVRATSFDSPSFIDALQCQGCLRKWELLSLLLWIPVDFFRNSCYRTRRLLFFRLIKGSAQTRRLNDITDCEMIDIGGGVLFWRYHSVSLLSFLSLPAMMLIICSY